MLAFSAFWLPARLKADQGAPAAVVAHIQGDDISINGEMLQRASTLAAVANGNVVTVHSGEASLQLVDGGEISICGPAKFTILASSDSAPETITFALQFGRMHVELPSAVKLRVLTPSIIATPIEISGGKRDLIVGLDQNNSMCVLATTGAVQLEQQFSGERLIVPESGDFSLESGQLIPVAGNAQNCQCAALPQIAPSAPLSPAPERALEAPPTIPPQAAASNAVNTPQSADPQTPAPVEVALLSRPNDDHPVSDAQPPAAAAPPLDSAPIKEIVLPPMVFSANSSGRTDIPTVETALLIREIHADPDWEFNGHVEAPDFARALSQSLGEGGSSANSPAPSGARQKRPGGFWATIKRIFAG
jgi:hypothetical protein